MTTRAQRNLAVLCALLAFRVSVDPSARGVVARAFGARVHADRDTSQALLQGAPRVRSRLLSSESTARRRATEYLRVEGDRRASESFALLITNDAEEAGLTVRSIFPATATADSGIIAATVEAQGATDELARWLANIDTATPRRRVRRLRLSFAGLSDNGTIAINATLEALLPPGSRALHSRKP